MLLRGRRATLGRHLGRTRSQHPPRCRSPVVECAKRRRKLERMPYNLFVGRSNGVEIVAGTLHPDNDIDAESLNDPQSSAIPARPKPSSIFGCLQPAMESGKVREPPRFFCCIPLSYNSGRIETPCHKWPHFFTLTDMLWTLPIGKWLRHQ